VQRSASEGTGEPRPGHELGFLARGSPESVLTSELLGRLAMRLQPTGHLERTLDVDVTYTPASSDEVVRQEVAFIPVSGFKDHLERRLGV
jgi:hypothetical protein